MIFVFQEITNLNKKIFLIINSYSKYELIIKNIYFLAEFPVYLTMVIIISYYFSSPIKKIRYISSILCSLLILISLHAIIRYNFYFPRPFVTKLGCLLIPHNLNSSFPSNHLGFICTCMVTSILEKSSYIITTILLILCFIIAWARIVSGIHWPLDMLGATITSLISGILGFNIVKYAFKKGY